MMDLDCIINAFISHLGIDNFKAVLKGEITTDEEFYADIMEDSKIIVFEEYVEKLANAASNNLDI